MGLYLVTPEHLGAIHNFMALALDAPPLKLDREQATSLAQAVNTFAEEYGIEISGKLAATLNLVATAMMIYVPAAINTVMYKRAKAEEKKKAEMAEAMKGPGAIPPNGGASDTATTV